MSGTAKVVESELIETYNLPVKVIKTHRKNRRKDHSYASYLTMEEKMKAVLNKIQLLHKTGQPLLIITGSVSSSELLSLYLLDLGIAHNVLNAKSGLKEAQMIQEAGHLGAVTVSTTMAGRGTDIKVTEASIAKGGLAVIVTERLVNQRGELQAKGRSGRQGEPGVTYSYESLEDDVIKQFVQENVQHYYKKKQKRVPHSLLKASPIKIRSPRIRRMFKRAQKKSEDQSQAQRTRALQYDNILKLQKDLIDDSRTKVLEFSDFPEILSFLKRQLSLTLDQYFQGKNSEEIASLQRFILDTLDYNFKASQAFLFVKGEEGIRNYLFALFERQLLQKKVALQDERAFIEYLKLSILKAIDLCWSSQIEVLSQLKYVVPLRTVAQKTPLIEYEAEAQKSYAYHREELSKSIIKNVALSLFEIKKGELIVTFP